MFKTVYQTRYKKVGPTGSYTSSNTSASKKQNLMDLKVDHSLEGNRCTVYQSHLKRLNSPP